METGEASRGQELQRQTGGCPCCSVVQLPASDSASLSLKQRQRHRLADRDSRFEVKLGVSYLCDLEEVA